MRWWALRRSSWPRRSVVLGVSLHATQTHARETLISRFQDRAQVVSALIQAEVSSVPSSAAATPAYTSATVDGAALDRADAQSHLAFVAILDRAGNGDRALAHHDLG